MFSTARRHGFPSSSANKQQHDQHQQQTKKKGKSIQQATALSAPPTPSNSSAQTPAQAYAAAAAARPATAAPAVGSFACRPVVHATSSVSALAAARPMTASGALPTATAASTSFPQALSSFSPSPSPSQAPLRLAMPRASASACATPSPLSSGLPSPTLPPLPASHFASCQPHGVGSSLPGHPVGAGVAGPATAAHVLRSPVININNGGSPLVHHARKPSLTSNGKDELVFDYRVRPSPHIRKF